MGSILFYAQDLLWKSLSEEERKYWVDKGKQELTRITEQDIKLLKGNKK